MAPTLIHPSSKPPTTYSGKSIKSISREAQRRQYLLQIEQEQHLEDAEALRMILAEAQHQALLLTFSSVKTEFTDLDGMKWTNPNLKRRFEEISPTASSSNVDVSRNMPTFATSPLHSTNFAILSDEELASFDEDDTIRVSKTVCRDRRQLPSTTHRPLSLSETKSLVPAGSSSSPLLCNPSSPAATVTKVESTSVIIQSHSPQSSLPTTITATSLLSRYRNRTRSRSPVKGLFAPHTADTDQIYGCPDIASYSTLGSSLIDGYEDFQVHQQPVQHELRRITERESQELTPTSAHPEDAAGTLRTPKGIEV